MSLFSGAARLSKRRDFQAVFANPRQTIHKYLLALYIPNHLPMARLGIMLAKRHVPLAVQRNRIRRVIRESFRQHQVASKGLDIVILLRSKWSTAIDNHRLREDLALLWQKLMHS